MAQVEAAMENTQCHLAAAVGTEHLKRLHPWPQASVVILSICLAKRA